jgi:uncharacterized OsmC-like protein
MTPPDPAPSASIRRYEVRAQTTRTFGRVLATARDQHFVVDGPVQNGCPGEAPTPAELFLSGVASCGAELLQVIAKEQGVPLGSVDITVAGIVDRGRQPRTDATVFTSVRIDIVLTQTDGARAAALVEAFKAR